MLVCSAVCGVTLAWSAVVKLQRPGRAAVSLVRFGLARRARRGAGRVLGLAEGAVAAALLTLPASPLPLAAAALLFAAFALLIARALRAGERFDCGCLGGDGETLGPATLLRAVALLAVALTGIAAGAAVAGGDAAAASAADRLLALGVGALLVLQAWAVARLRRLEPFDPALRGMPAPAPPEAGAP